MQLFPDPPPDAAARVVVACRPSDGGNYTRRLFSHYPLKWIAHRPTVGTAEEQAGGAPELVLYLSGFGGGVISGDVQLVRVDVEAGARAAVVTQSTTKVFKAVDGLWSRRWVEASVARGGMLALVGQPVVLCAGSKHSLAQEVRLEDGSSSLLAVEWFTAGRAAQDGQWQCAEFRSALRVRQAGRLVLHDALCLRGGGALQRHMGGARVSCTVTLVGPALATTAARLLGSHASRPEGMGAGDTGGDGGVLAACGRGPLPGCVLLRVAGAGMEPVARFLAHHVGTADGALAHNPFAALLNSSCAAAATAAAAAPRLHFTPGDPDDGAQLPALLPDAVPPAAATDPAAACATPAAAQWCVELCAWQLLDSKLPTGGFAHSAGLEAACRVGMVARTDAGVCKFVTESLVRAAAGTVPFVVAAAQEGARAREGQQGCDAAAAALLALDAAFHATMTDEVARAASLRQGSALLRAAESAFEEQRAVLRAVQVRLAALPSQLDLCPDAGHLPVLHGFVCGVAGIAPDAAARMLLFGLVRNLCLAAVRLNLVGPMRSEALQHTILRSLPLVLARVAHLTPADAHQVAPMLGLVGAMHSRLYSRIFAS